MTPTPTLTYERRPSAVAYMLRGATPAAHRAQSRPLLVVRWRDHRVDPNELAAFLRVTGLPGSSRLPLLYPHVFGFRLSMAVLTHPAFPVPIWGVVQTRNHLLSHRAIDVDEVLDFETRVSERRVLEKGQELDLHTRVRVGSEFAWESLVTFFARGRFGAPTGASPLAQSPSDFGTPTASWKMSNDAHFQFGHFTGDYNGIHLWDWYARRFGFRGALYHPARVLGQCLARLPTPSGGGPQRLDAWLKGPVLHGAEVGLRHAESGDATTFALFAGAERPSIVGRFGPVPARSRLVADDRQNT
jgi:hypothetical protein